MSSEYFTYELRDGIALIGINRPDKRNAMRYAMFGELGRLSERAGEEARAAVIHGVGPHFCAGLDLAEVVERLRTEGRRKAHATTGYSPLDHIARGRVPVVAALSGAVIGAGLEIAAAAHIRVADDTAFFGLPEAKRGIFVGAGGSVRIQRMLGTARMTDMMLTGRILDADEGHQYNVAQYRVPAGESLAKALELAAVVAHNTPESNWAIMHGLSRVNDMSYDDALFVETLVANSTISDGSQQRLNDFVEKRAEPLARPSSSTV